YRDMVDLQHRLVTDVLGIKRLHAIVGLSMGGMNAWQWATTYPDEVRGIMTVVALPTPIAGRNLLWRRIVIDSIRSDPEWQNGDYTKPPAGWVRSGPLYRMMLDGVPRLQREITDTGAADRYVKQEFEQARLRDANDVLYALEAANDFDVRPQL